MPTAKDVLIEARKLLAARDGWTKGTWARTPSGEPCKPESNRATCFCVHGALVHAASGFSSPGREEAYDYLREAAGDPDGFPGKWNDRSSYEEVMGAFDKAIAKATGG